MNGKRVHLYEEFPSLRELVERLQQEERDGVFTHQYSTGITFNKNEFAEFMDWIIEKLS